MKMLMWTGKKLSFTLDGYWIQYYRYWSMSSTKSIGMNEKWTGSTGVIL